MNKKRIEHAINLVGFYPVLSILKEEQAKENYNNCILLKDGLDDFLKSPDLEGLSSSTDENSMNTTYNIILKSQKYPEFIHEVMPKIIDFGRRILYAEKGDIVKVEIHNQVRRVKVNC